MRKEKKRRIVKIILSILILSLFLLFIVLMYCNHKNTSTKTVEEKELMVFEQAKKKKNFKQKDIP